MVGSILYSFFPHFPSKIRIFHSDILTKRLFSDFFLVFPSLQTFDKIASLVLTTRYYSTHSSAGKYSPARGASSNNDCIVCTAGTYGTELGCNVNIADLAINDSVTTSAGTTSAPSLRSCTYSCRQCDKGKWSDDKGATLSSTCELCPEGKFLNSRGNVELADCILCPKGRYGTVKGAVSGIYVSNVASNLMCTGCLEGKYNNNEGSTAIAACVDCAVGKWLETNNDAVAASNVAQTDCKECKSGRYGDQLGLTFSNQQIDNTGTNIHVKYCKACPAGKYVEETGCTLATDCVSRSFFLCFHIEQVLTFFSIFFTLLNYCTQIFNIQYCCTV